MVLSVLIVQLTLEQEVLPVSLSLSALSFVSLVKRPAVIVSFQHFVTQTPLSSGTVDLILITHSQSATRTEVTLTTKITGHTSERFFVVVVGIIKNMHTISGK